MATAAIPVLTPDVGNDFVREYYTLLRQSPELVHRFYQDISKLGRPEPDGIISTTTTIIAINEKILSLGYGDFRAEIMSIDSQESYNGGVIVLVTGYLTGNENAQRKFIQSFFLAPQHNGYFVLNDVFRYVDEANYPHVGLAPVNNVEAPFVPEQDLFTVQGNTNQIFEEVNGVEIYSPSKNGDCSVEEEEAPVHEIVDEIRDDSPMEADSLGVPESNSNIEETPKKSYASIVKVLKENAPPFSSPAAILMRSAPKSLVKVATAVPATPVSDTNVSSSVVAENGNSQEGEDEGHWIYLKDLPVNSTNALVDKEFSKLGTIRPGGIQVLSKKAFCFGFVEFDSAIAVRSAVMGSPFIIGDCWVTVEKYKPNSREGHFIYLKGLPLNATPAQLEEAFHMLGTIKTGGVQVQCQKDFCFGFVEFDSATSVQRAIEASPLRIDEYWVTVEEKKSVSRANFFKFPVEIRGGEGIIA